MIDPQDAAKQVLEELDQPPSSGYHEQFIPFKAAQIRLPLKDKEGRLLDPVIVVENLKRIKNTIVELLLDLDQQNRSAIRETRQRVNRRMLSTVCSEIHLLNKQMDVRPRRRKASDE